MPGQILSRCVRGGRCAITRFTLTLPAEVRACTTVAIEIAAVSPFTTAHFVTILRSTLPIHGVHRWKSSACPGIACSRCTVLSAQPCSANSQLMHLASIRSGGERLTWNYRTSRSRHCNTGNQSQDMIAFHGWVRKSHPRPMAVENLAASLAFGNLILGDSLLCCITKA